MPRMITVLEDSIRYRDGKKWKKRNCFLSKPDTKKRTVTMFITKQYGTNITIQDIDDKSLRQYLVDEISGFEHGRHVDKESHVMALIGSNGVYCIAFEHTDTMFRWAETLSKLLRSVNFHATLKRVSENGVVFNRINVGTQGNLHVQQNRLCLIGEPADGNKLICEWPMMNLISVDIEDTPSDKVKRVTIKSSGKTNKGKGTFEFEISLGPTSIFEDTFLTFLKACSVANPEFISNLLAKADRCGERPDLCHSASTTSTMDTHGMNSENCGSFEKRSSEIPIPRSREHSGPDQRPIENVQIKMRKSHKNLQKTKNDLHKHYSVTEITAKHDNDGCLFPDDEEIEEQVRHKSQNFLCLGLSQDSSGVSVNGPADSMREADLSLGVSVQNDSGCSIFPSRPTQSTSTNSHDNTLPPSENNNRFLTFYRNVYRNPLSLTSYTNYYRLLKTISDQGSQLLKRSNSFNCVHLPEIKTFDYSRKFSYANFPFNASGKVSEPHLRSWRDKVASDSSIEDTLRYASPDRDKFDDPGDSSNILFANRLPFRSMRDFHCSMLGSLQSGTVCFSLFSYHHFLSLLKHVRSVLKNLETKVSTANDIMIEYRDLKDKITRKNKVYNQWLERVQSSSRCPWDPEVTEPSILDINNMLVFEIIDSILHTRYNDMAPRHMPPILDTNPTIEVNEDKYIMSCSTTDHHSSDQSTGTTSSPGYLESRSIICMSCSTPNFCNYPQHDSIAPFKLSCNSETRYQNLSPNDTFNESPMNHTFPKYNTSLNTPMSAHNKEGSFKRFRRKYSPNVFIPFIRRKTSSIHSNLSEPICRQDTKDHNSYYNFNYQREVTTKKSLSAVLDNGPYINVKQDSKYINLSKNPEPSPFSGGSSNYLDTQNTCIYDDNTPYPEEIIDPSRNYGDLNFIQTKMRLNPRYDPSADSFNFRRSSLSILSQKSLQNIGTFRAVSFNNRGCSNISRVHSDACNNSSSNFRSSTDYINVKTLAASPQSRTLPPSLNYVTVMEHSRCQRLGAPLSIHTEYQHINTAPHRTTIDHSPSTDSGNILTSNRRPWLSPQAASSVVDYCQIDLNCTYALRDIDRMLCDKARSNDASTSLKNLSPGDGDSLRSADGMSDNQSMSSVKKASKKHGKKSLRNIFSRKT